MLDTEGGSTKSQCVENSPWKWLWTSCKTDYGIMNLNKYDTSHSYVSLVNSNQYKTREFSLKAFKSMSTIYIFLLTTKYAVLALFP
jgi:hypothetical protein